MKQLTNGLWFCTVLTLKQYVTKLCKNKQPFSETTKDAEKL